MVLDPTRPLIRLLPSSDVTDRIKKSGFSPKPQKFSCAHQSNKYSPIFKQLKEASELELRSDPTALAPERLIVFELATSVQNFIKAIEKVSGLLFVDEEELDSSDGDQEPVMYLLMPNMQALKQIESLWSRWSKGERLDHGLTAWEEVFSYLRVLRPWGPNDRVDATSIENFKFNMENEKGNVFAEIELVFQQTDENAEKAVQQVSSFVLQKGGSIKSEARIDAIGYHALLAELPPQEILNIINLNMNSIAGLDPVMFIRPQARMTASPVEEGDLAETIPTTDLKSPIAALLDGVPVASHSWLSHHLVVDDIFNLEQSVLVKDRVHGSAMASLIIHGDRNTKTFAPPLPRKIVHIPVFDSGDKFSSDRLVVDIVYQALMDLVSEQNEYCKDVLVVNLSLGIANYRFQRRISPLARLIDWFSEKYGILCIVSAGNITEPFNVPLLDNKSDIKALKSQELGKAILSAIDGLKGQRRLLSPAETVNGVTVGALNSDLIEESQRGDGLSRSRPRIDPFGDIAMSNPTSALGPGFANAIKPDILMAGSKEQIELHHVKDSYDGYPQPATKFAGLKVAAAPRIGEENATGWTGGTSAAAALASRTTHRIHDALEDVYQDDFTDIPKIQRAALLKALLVHSAKWPQKTRDFIKDTVGPHDNRQHVRQKENVRRYIGYGVVDEDFAVSCAADRATFWTTGTIGPDKRRKIMLPIPECYIGKAQSHRIAATLAWFTPVNVGRSAYRSIKLDLEDPKEIGILAVNATGNQPDRNQIKRGIVISRFWEGHKAAVINGKNKIAIYIQRNPDGGSRIDKDIAFGLALTIEMPGVNEVYDQVKEMLSTPVETRYLIEI